MGIERLSLRVLAGFTLFTGFGLAVHAQPPVDDGGGRGSGDSPSNRASTSARRRRRAGAQCKVEVIPNKNDRRPRSATSSATRPATRSASS